MCECQLVYMQVQTHMGSPADHRHLPELARRDVTFGDPVDVLLKVGAEAGHAEGPAAGGMQKRIGLVSLVKEGK